jgi:hypothetical protein
MGVALVNAGVRDAPLLLRWFVETYRQKSGGLVSQNEFLVDYSQLDSLIGSTIDALDPAALAGTNMKDRIILLGRTKNTTDIFAVPGKPEQTYPGVYLHACAAFTLLETRPLYRLTDFGRISLDLFFSVAIFGSVLLRRWFRLRQGKKVVIGRQMPERLSWLMALVLGLGATLFVHWSHLMWDDFILVVVALVVHTPIEHNTVEMGEWLWKKVRSRRHVTSSAATSPSEGE